MNDKLQRFNNVIGFLNVIVVGVIVGMVIWAMAGCRTTPPSGAKYLRLACAETEIYMYTPESWTDDDQFAYETAGRRCAEHYPRSPCVRKFIRYGALRYGVICGGAEDNELNLEVIK